MPHPSCGEKTMELGSGGAGERLPAIYAPVYPPYYACGKPGTDWERDQSRILPGWSWPRQRKGLETHLLCKLCLPAASVAVRGREELTDHSRLSHTAWCPPTRTPLGPLLWVQRYKGFHLRARGCFQEPLQAVNLGSRVQKPRIPSLPNLRTPQLGTLTFGQPCSLTFLSGDRSPLLIAAR